MIFFVCEINRLIINCEEIKDVVEMKEKGKNCLDFAEEHRKEPDEMEKSVCDKRFLKMDFRLMMWVKRWCIKSKFYTLLISEHLSPDY